MLCAATLVMSLGALKVSQRTQLVRVGYELSEATQTLRVLSEENRRLRLEKSMLSHPERIERFARERGLRSPAPGQLRVLPGEAVP
jgi:cell division protein FtsL